MHLDMLILVIEAYHRAFLWVLMPGGNIFYGVFNMKTIRQPQVMKTPLDATTKVSSRRDSVIIIAHRPIASQVFSSAHVLQTRVP